MISFRDKTFCTHWEYCLDSELCGRALTDEVKRSADEWWGEEGAPICMFANQPNCFVESA